jgi:hypothetical protein
MSFRDIGAILNKKEASAVNNDGSGTGNGIVVVDNQQQQQQSNDNNNNKSRKTNNMLSSNDNDYDYYTKRERIVLSIQSMPRGRYCTEFQILCAV